MSHSQLFSDKAHHAQQIATELFHAKPQPDWVTFFREILGVDGAVRHLFPDPRDIEAFHKTGQYRAIQFMLGRLHTEELNQQATEPTQMITPRLPKSLHAALLAEVEDLRKDGHPKMSLNQLVTLKLCAATLDHMLPPRETQHDTGESME